MLGGLGLALTLRAEIDDGTRMTLVFGSLGATLLAIVVIALASFRVHRWTVLADGIRIEERPKVPLTGLRRRATVAFGDVMALHRVQSGFDARLELRARDGRRFRLAQAFGPEDARGVRVPDPAGLANFAAAIEGALRAAGHPMPDLAEALSFWNRPAGLAVLTVAFALALVMGIGVVWSFIVEGAPPARARAGEMMGILILLPVGAAYLLIRSVQRRRAVLAAQRRR